MHEMIDRMKIIIKQNGLNAKQVTIMLGISSSSFTDWGKGKGTPSVATLTKFADYFHVSLDYLVRGDNGNIKTLDISNSMDKDLLDKFHMLTPDLQQKVLGYVEAMTDLIPENDESSQKLSG